MNKKTIPLWVNKAKESHLWINVSLIYASPSDLHISLIFEIIDMRVTSTLSGVNTGLLLLTRRPRPSQGVYTSATRWMDNRTINCPYSLRLSHGGVAPFRRCMVGGWQPQCENLTWLYMGKARQSESCTRFRVCVIGEYTAGGTSLSPLFHSFGK